LEYDLEARLSQCTGIRTVGLAKLNELETTDFVTGELGNLSAKVGAVLKVGGVSCSGSARAMVQPCIEGARIPASGSVKAALAIDNIVGRIGAKIVEGTDSNKGKMCLQVTEMEGHVPLDGAHWSAYNVNLAKTMPVGFPTAIKNDDWDGLPFQSVVDTLKTKVLGVVQQQLVNIVPCF
jgi:hypothetical protein